MDTGLAALTAPLAAMMPALPAATLTALSVGVPHPHSHPPSLIPPAPPVPLPSIGTVMMAGCLSVLIGGMPAARCGDVGMVVTCGSLMPPMMIFTGSSNVFIGGRRAARMTDMTIHCMPAAKGAPTTMAGVMKASAVGAGVSLLGAAASASAGAGLQAAMQAAQAAADIAAEAIKALLGKDPGLAPDMGALMIGNPTVLIGGFPLPDSSVVLEGLKKLARRVSSSAPSACDPMATASPLFDLIVYFRKYQRIPEDWVRGLSAAGELDEAARAAWLSETDPDPMTWLAAYFADRRARALVAVDLGRMLLPYLSTKQKKVPAAALDFMERWATEPGVPEPKQGWLALADSAEPDSESDALWVIAAQTIVAALTVPDYPMALKSLCEGVIDRKVDETVEGQRPRGRRLGELEMDAHHDRVHDAIAPEIIEHLRARIAAPTGAQLLDALTQLRAYELNDALARKNTASLAAFKPD
jgi:uncharacterized Zn-binding protein involved in type VI secretion